MPTLTRENAKQHCRTCLMRLVATEGAHKTRETAVEEVPEFKDELCINITTNTELQELIAKYVEDHGARDSGAVGFPHSMCLGCYNKLQGFEKFRKRARDSAEKLHAVFSNSGVTKVELDYDDAEGDSDHRVINNDDEDIYKLLLKDTLMETESVMLDNSAVATLASVEMQDPDPFDTTTPAPTKKAAAKKVTAKRAATKMATDDEDDGYQWQGNLDNDSSSSESEKEDAIKPKIKAKTNKLIETAAESDEDDDDEDADSEDEEDDEEEEKNHRPGLRSSTKAEESKQLKTQKKKRRTKKEMEEWRKTQAEKLESKAKRRNKGTKNNFKCSQCNHCFAHKITLDAHIRKVHEGSKRPFQCDRCDKAYTFIGGLYTHIKEIHEAEVRSYACDQPGCDRIYTSFIAMQKHKRTKHTDIGHQKKYVCEQCGATFNQIGNLKYHRRSKHPTEAEQAEKEKAKERYECTICNKHFHSRYTLKYHTLQLHSNDMKFECNVCGRRMAKKFMLVQHMLVHSTDKMPCEHCGKQFIRKFELEAHIRAVHMKLKPFECQYCSECFASRKTLRHHEYIHTGEKPYVCDICGQAYRQQTCLKNHRKSHEKLSAEALLAANINRTLMSTFLGPGGPAPQQQPPVVAAGPTNLNEVYK